MRMHANDRSFTDNILCIAFLRMYEMNLGVAEEGGLVLLQKRKVRMY